MPMYKSIGARFNTTELDPCLAAEVRIKNDLLEIRSARFSVLNYCFKILYIHFLKFF